MIRVRRAPAASILGIGLLAAWLLSAGPSHARHPGPQVRAPGKPTVDCATRSQVIPSSDPGRLVNELRRDSVLLGPVMVAGGRVWADEPRSSFEPKPGRLASVKAPLFVDAGRPATISLSPGSRRHAVIAVGLDRALHPVRAPSIRLIPCPPDATVAGRRVGRRTPFLGGFRLDGPRCLHLEVLADGATEPIRKRIAFGRYTCT